MAAATTSDSGRIGAQPPFKKARLSFEEVLKQGLERQKNMIALVHEDRPTEGAIRKWRITTAMASKRCTPRPQNNLPIYFDPKGSQIGTFDGKVNYYGPLPGTKAHAADIACNRESVMAFAGTLLQVGEDLNSTRLTIQFEVDDNRPPWKPGNSGGNPPRRTASRNLNYGHPPAHSGVNAMPFVVSSLSHRSSVNHRLSLRRLAAQPSVGQVDVIMGGSKPPNDDSSMPVKEEPSPNF
ncbi:hypothetical protein B0T14DRAFT_568465 [Immersiella caudata]|uniref:Uncharacterized protein n=1 Tax=Immersiella caudata TaxID=314043 RepID=A0AA40BX77_9PEZI|nr:hypothetical protein B0T14DRAFT_568465 [Immersiella caudata]